jgi:Tfp pilus assembly protein PilF
VELARLLEQKGKLADAEQQYRKALNLSPDYLGALLGYALLKDRMNKPQEALELFRKAAKAHPKHPSIYNNLGLFYNRHGMLREGARQLKRAIALAPDRVNYRSNIAVVLVKMGQNREALEHLRAVHSEAVAHYNLGYLLMEKGEKQAAAQNLATALRRDPSLVQAKQLLRYMSQATNYADRPEYGPRMGNRPATRGTTYDGRGYAPDAPQRTVPPGPSTGQTISQPRSMHPNAPPSTQTPSARRLPPPSSLRAGSPAAPMPRGPVRPRITPSAPLPTGSGPTGR